MNKKVLTVSVCVALLVTLISGCASKTNKNTDTKMSLADATFPPYVTDAAKITKNDSTDTDITSEESLLDVTVIEDPSDDIAQ